MSYNNIKNHNWRKNVIMLELNPKLCIACETNDGTIELPHEKAICEDCFEILGKMLSRIE